MTTQSTEDNLHDGEWVRQLVIEAFQHRERRFDAIAKRNAELRVEILQYAMRDSLR